MKRSLRRAPRFLAPLVVVVAISAVAATTAFAGHGGGCNVSGVCLTGDGTIVGTSNNDQLTALNGQDTIWGLGGSDTIKLGTGMDVVDAGGACTPGVMTGKVYPNGFPAGQYCAHQSTAPYGNTTIDSAGTSGQDVVYTNGCASTGSPSATATVTLGNGSDVVYSNGGPNSITLGNGSDTVYAANECHGATLIKVGTGSNTIYAQNGLVDTIYCGSSHTTVYGDHIDKFAKGSQCTIKYTAPPAADRRWVRIHRSVKHRAHHRSHGRRHRRARRG
jgi:hypothetical protein